PYVSAWADVPPTPRSTRSSRSSRPSSRSFAPPLPHSPRKPLMTSIMPTEKATVLVAMSGGVDSCVAAALLHRAGHQVIGVTMKLWCYAEGPSPSRGCCTLEAIDDCRAVARKVGFPHYVLNMEDDFREHVIENFVGEYMAGRTPNPCVQCNNWLKFGE